jgi:predicted DNA-binding transcriptional regulator YafY
MERGGIRSWLLNTFSVNNLINESHHLKGRILFEEIPSGQRFLTPIIEAMRDNLSIEMDYQPFGHDEPITINIDPYCLKIFKQRWYIIGKSVYQNAIRTYSLDRIQDLRTTETPFKIPKTFKPESYFENSFGINKHDDIKPCIVKLKVFGKKRKYLQTLPIHSSQQEIETKEEYSVFSCYIAPTADLQTELLSHGSEIEVLSPEKLRADIASTVKKMFELYE